MKTIVTVITAVLVWVVVVHAQAPLTGKWQGETKNGTQIVLDLKATETTMTGTLTQGGQAATIADGKVSKNTFTFKATFNSRTDGFTGQLSGDQITITLDRLGPSSTAILKRVKD